MPPQRTEEVSWSDCVSDRAAKICLAITSLKKGAYLLKYGRRGKPKFCPFRLSNATFQRYPRPEKEYQSFSLIYNDRSLDLDPEDTEGVPLENTSQARLAKAFCDIISYTAAGKSASQAESITNPSLSSGSLETSNNRISTDEKAFIPHFLCCHALLFF